MAYSHILFEQDDAVIAVGTVNRPDKVNALSMNVVTELNEAFERIARDRNLRAGIVTGAGEKAFVAGADINELAVLSAYEARDCALRGQAAWRTLETAGQANVAPIQGHPLRGGPGVAPGCPGRFPRGKGKRGATRGKARGQPRF